MNLTKPIATPAFVIDQAILEADLAVVREIADQASCRMLYSPKACALTDVLRHVSRHVDGFACSSPYELELIQRVCGDAGSLHLISPLIKAETLEVFGDRLASVTFNSLSQWERLGTKASARTRRGLRINPQLSFVRDQRYDPCRRNSKLGVPVHDLAELARSDPGRLEGIDGLHFHTNCDATDFASLLATARHIEDEIPHVLERMDWINLGGGYLFTEANDLADFFEGVAIFRQRFGLDVFIEPGAALVRRAGTIEATVHDVLAGDDLQIAVLDTAVNHMPEVFEFQFEPDVLGHVDGGLHGYILAGCTCMAGDVFGEYAFDIPLAVGSRVTFLNMGAYTISKAHRFNGVGLPSIYLRWRDGSLKLVREDSFEEFAHLSGVAGRAVA
jgi:carboxynorspermidine decarboxylase